MEKCRLFIRGIAIVGLSVYLPLFLLVLVWPGLVARAGKAIIVREVNEHVAKLGVLGTVVTEKAADLGEKLKLLRTGKEAFEKRMTELTPDVTVEELIAFLVEDLVDHDAKRGELVSFSSRDSTGSPAARSPDNTIVGSAEMMLDSAASTATANATEHRRARIMHALNEQMRLTEQFPLLLGRTLSRLENAVVDKYKSTLRALVREARIFTGSNVLVFALLWLAAGSHSRIQQLFLPALLFFLVTLAVTYLYFRETNWIYAILHQRYMGWGYLSMVILLTIYLGYPLLDVVKPKLDSGAEIKDTES